MEGCNGKNCQQVADDHSPECIAEHECAYTGIEPIEVVTYAAGLLGISTDQLVSQAKAKRPMTDSQSDSLSQNGK